MPLAMKVTVGKVAALALVAVVAFGCGKSSSGVRNSDAGAAVDAPTPSADLGSRSDMRAMDAPVDVAAEVRPRDAGPADVRVSSDGHADAAVPVDASKPDAPAPGDAGGCVVATGGVLDWDVSPITLTGHLTVNGAATGVNGRGQFWLVDRATGDEALLGDTYTSTATRPPWSRKRTTSSTATARRPSRPSSTGPATVGAWCAPACR